MDNCEFCQKPECECRCFYCKICGDYDGLITAPDKTSCRCSQRYPFDSEASQNAAIALLEKGINACWVCGRALAVCDRQAIEEGFDDCEEWASH